jgi:type I restriction enzyme S subunit
MGELQQINKSGGSQSKEGYKKTKLGWIPEDWRIKQLGDLGFFTKGKGISKSETTSDGLQCVRYGELYTHYDNVFEETISFISEETANTSVEINRDDILFTCSGEDRKDIGKALAFNGTQPTYAGGDLAIFKSDKFESLFLSSFANSSLGKKQKHSLAQGHSVVHIYSKQLSQLYIPLPSLSEQKAIADCLSTWDAAINKQTQLVAAKQELKKALMQQLLSGKKRLPGFDGEWETNRFDYLLDYTPRPVQKPNTSFTKLGIRSHCKGTFQNIGFEPENIAIDTLYMVKPKDLIVNITFAWEGAVAIVKDKDIGALVSHRFPTYTFKEGISDADFFKQFIKSKRFRYLLELISPGGAGRNRVLSKKELNKLKITIPPYQEQTAIAQVLNAADKEITLLNNQLEQLKAQKRGLMQQLLTGKKRLKF